MKKTWKGWAIVTKDRSEVRYVTGGREYKPVLPKIFGLGEKSLRRIKVEIREVR